jgi:hypothetical protein
VRYKGDAGFSTRNPLYAGTEKAVMEYHLSNGERDEYPASWNVTTGEAFYALEYFFEEAARLHGCIGMTILRNETCDLAARILRAGTNRRQNILNPVVHL